jgi:hypothetical protein
MTRQLSFKVHQREVEPHYRNQIDAAESTEDVRKFFERTVLDFLRKAIGDQVEMQPGDVLFNPELESGYVFSQRLLENEGFRQLHGDSDLPFILRILSDRALNRYKHLVTKQPDKTEKKIFPVPDRASNRY